MVGWKQKFALPFAAFLGMVVSCQTSGDDDSASAGAANAGSGATSGTDGGEGGKQAGAAGATSGNAGGQPDEGGGPSSGGAAGHTDMSPGAGGESVGGRGGEAGAGSPTASLTCNANAPVTVGAVDQKAGVTAITLDRCDHLFVAAEDGDGSTISAYDGLKKPVWTRKLAASSGKLVVTALVANDDGEIFVAGSLTGALPSVPSAGGNDFFVAKLGPDGHVAWIQDLGGPGNDSVLGAAQGPDGSLYIEGNAGKLATETDAPSNSAYLARITGAGEFAWVTRLDAPAVDISAEYEGNVYLAVGTVIERYNSKGGATLAFDMNTQEFPNFDSTNGPARLTSIAVSWNGDFVYVAGMYGGDEENELADAFVAEVEPTGLLGGVFNVGFADGITDVATTADGMKMYAVGLAEVYPMMLAFDPNLQSADWEFSTTPGPQGYVDTVVVGAQATAIHGDSTDNSSGDTVELGEVIARGEL